MSKGTILYLGGFELPDKNAAAHRVISNGKLLRDLGYKVVFCGMNKKKERDNPLTPSCYFDFECYAINYPKSIYAWFKYITEYKHYLKLLDNEEDVKAIICYNLPAASIYQLKNYCNKKRIKIISDCTEWYEAPQTGNILNRFVKQTDIIWRMRSLNFKLDGVISISEYLNRYYSMYKQKSIKVPPLVDIKDEKWANPEVLIDRPIQLVYSGSPFSLTDKSSVKDRLDLIISAMAELKREDCNFYLHILGIEVENFLVIYPNFKKDIALLENSIKFYGRLEHSKAIEILKSCDFSIFIRDSSILTKAGFPTKFVESISCGIPVLTNKNSNIEDYLQEGENGFLVSIESSESTKKSLHKALSMSPKEVYEMKLNCKNSKIFDYHNYLEDFKVLLN